MGNLKFEFVRELLRKEFKSVFEQVKVRFENSPSQQLEILRYFQEKVVTEINKRIKENTSSNDLMKDFKDKTFVEYVLKGEKVSKDNDNQNHFYTECISSKYEYLESFISGSKKNRVRTCEFFSICCDYKGLNHFISKNEKKLIELQNEYNSISTKKSIKYSESLNCDSNTSQVNARVNTISDKHLSQVFKNPCYLYVYDEDLKDSKKNNYSLDRDFHYPCLDALVLEYRNNVFILHNIKGRNIDHGKGIFRWVNNHMNVFEISFPDSLRGLILRFNYPTQEIAKDSKAKVNLLFGAFILNTYSGKIVTGNVIIRKKTTPIASYKYDVRTPKPKNLKTSVVQYFYDRHRNWHKVPHSMYNDKQFDEWLTKKYSQDYTANKPTVQDFLVTYPVSSFSQDLVENKNILTTFQEKLKSVLTDFKDNHVLLSIDKAKNNYIPNNEYSVQDKVKYISSYLSSAFKKERIKIFPEGRMKYFQKNGSLTSLKNKMYIEFNQSRYVVIILPNKGYSKPSSILPALGYLEHAKRTTFVMKERGAVMPNLYKDSNRNNGYHVFEYDELGEIPFILYERYFRKIRGLK